MTYKQPLAHFSTHIRHSEFGMPSMPCMKTIDYWMDGADEKERYAQSPLMAQHCRAGVFERRFAIAMNDNFRLTEDLETYVPLGTSGRGSDNRVHKRGVYHSTDAKRSCGLRISKLETEVGWSRKTICVPPPLALSSIWY